MICILKTVENIRRKLPNGWIETGRSFSDAEPAISLQKQKYTLLGGNGNIPEI